MVHTVGLIEFEFQEAEWVASIWKLEHSTYIPEQRVTP